MDFDKGLGLQVILWFLHALIGSLVDLVAIALFNLTSQVCHVHDWLARTKNKYGRMNAKFCSKNTSTASLPTFCICCWSFFVTMVVSCCVVGCIQRYKANSSISFNRFPKNEPKKSLWENALKRKDWKPNENSRVCGLHFITGE